MLQRHGITKGSTVAIYMPMVPEAVYAMLACARLGAIHSVLFTHDEGSNFQGRLCGVLCGRSSRSHPRRSLLVANNIRPRQTGWQIDSGIANCITAYSLS